MNVKKIKNDKWFVLWADDLDKQTKQKHGSTYIKRVIVHPSFHNISYKEAEKLLVSLFFVTIPCFG